MSYELNDTHDPNLRSWVESANQPDTDFPIQNLPFGVFRRSGSHRIEMVGVAIGDQILDLYAAVSADLFDGPAKAAAKACCDSSLNVLMMLGHQCWSALRQRLSELLRENNTEIEGNHVLVKRLLVPMAEAELFVPAQIGDYTDFYASIFHATNIGRMFRPDNPLLPNYKYVPIAYHGRASTVVVSGTEVKRPRGQLKEESEERPSFGPSKLLDYELEVGFFVGPGNKLGETIRMAEAEGNIFGLCLVNDWSARDIQRWEYQPLGPFLAKSFATTISPWVVTLEALAPYRVPAFTRPEGDPEPLPYLDSPECRRQGGIDLTLEVYLSSRQMRDQGLEPLRLSRGNFKEMYWTIAQMLVHHASNGCALRPGDLVASGTVSGATRQSQGCLIELTARGTEPIQLPTGEARRFLQDGDEVILRGACERDGFARIGFGECRGVVIPAIDRG